MSDERNTMNMGRRDMFLRGTALAATAGAHILKTYSAEEWTFHVVKLVFPRGDAASLLFGLDRAGKITGISLLGMAGD